MTFLQRWGQGRSKVADAFITSYLEKGRTNTGAYYAALLDRLVDEIRKKRPHFKKKKILFHDDNALSHTLNIAQLKKNELGFESLPHLPYLSNLAPSNFYLFPNLESRRLELNEEVKWEKEGYFEGFDESHYLWGIEKLNDRWSYCIELQGEYIEKQNRFLPKQFILFHSITPILNALVWTLSSCFRVWHFHR